LAEFHFLPQTISSFCLTAVCVGSWVFFGSFWLKEFVKDLKVKLYS